MKISTRAILSGLMLAGTILATSPARASDVTFDVNAVVTDIPHTSAYTGDAVTGTLTINTATGTFDAADITVPGFAAFTGTGTTTCGPDDCVFVFNLGFADFGEFDYGVGTLIGYAGGALGPDSNMDLNSVAYTITGTVTPQGTGDVAAATPEPSSLALLGTGMFGLVGLVRRKLAA